MIILIKRSTKIDKIKNRREKAMENEQALTLEYLIKKSGIKGVKKLRKEIVRLMRASERAEKSVNEMVKAYEASRLLIKNGIDIEIEVKKAKGKEKK